MYYYDITRKIIESDKIKVFFYHNASHSRKHLPIKYINLITLLAKGMHLGNGQCLLTI